MRALRVTGLALLAILLAAFAGVGRPESASTQATTAEHEITVSGGGVSRAVPDRAQFSFGVETEAATATQALNGNAAEMRRMIAAVKAEGVAAADIQTQQVSLSATRLGGTITGYEARNSVSATLRDLDRAGAVIDAAVRAGANQVSGPGFLRSDSRALYRAALRAAVADARVKAEAIAAAGGVALGAVTHVHEGGGASSRFDLASADEPTPIEPGVQEIHAGVTVTFAIA